MAILDGNLKTLKSDTMSDAPDGGGEITSQQIISGSTNAIFNDVSTGDRTNGAVRLRKVYQKVDSQDRSVYLKARSILTHVPKDDNVDVLLFATDDPHDRLTDVKSRIEAYRTKGSNYLGFLFATQFKGSKVLTIFQDKSTPDPEIGDVLYLSQDLESFTQYVKITDVSSEVKTFTGGTPPRNFERKIVTCTISSPLKYDFIGSQITDKDDINPRATILTTIVANAAKYYSARPIKAPAAIGDTTINVSSVFAQLVPASIREIGTTSVDPIAVATGIGKGADDTVSIISNVQWGGTRTLTLGSPIYPTSLEILYNNILYTDVSGALSANGQVVASVDYANGSLLFNDIQGESVGQATIKYIVGALGASVARTAAIDVSANNRGFVYAITLLPQPERGSVKLDFRSLKNWQTLIDNGAGQLVSPVDGVGRADIDYLTGSVNITLEALPDVDSSILFTWGRGNNTANWVGSTFPKIHLNRYIGLGAKGSTGTVTWGSKTATIAADGTISGDATGSLLTNGLLTLTPDTMPAKGTNITVSTANAVVEVQSFSEVTWDSATNEVSGVVNNSADIQLGSVSISYFVATGHVWQHYFTRAVAQRLITVTDDGVGNLIFQGSNIGTIDYVTGAFSFNPDIARLVFRIPITTGNPTLVSHVIRDNEDVQVVSSPAASKVNSHWRMDISPLDSDLSVSGLKHPVGNLDVTYSTDGTTTNNAVVFSLEQLTLDLGDVVSGVMSKGSLHFNALGRLYQLSTNTSNTLISNQDVSDNTFDISGSVELTSSIVSITDWDADSAEVQPTINAVASTASVGSIQQLVFRVPNAPVRVEAFQLRIKEVATDTVHIANADANGNILGDDIVGTIVYATGVVEVRFGATVTAAGNESEWWYDANAVVGGTIFRPTLMQPNSAVYDAVTQRFLPLDAEVVGVDAVRLPEDGRVPVYNSGDTTVIMNTGIVTDTFTSSTTTDLGRTNIDNLVVKDSNGALLPSTAYTSDLPAGTIDWGDLATVAQPITVEHRVEDELILDNVDITGSLTFTEPFTHDYPVVGTVVSSAVLHSDMFARVDTQFVQKTWTNEWSDTVIGDDILPKYNDSSYPILVTNDSAVSERWVFVFKSSTHVDVVGEFAGVVITNAPIAALIAPTNPATGAPYFTIPPAGWGLGWASGNVFRFNTTGAYRALWMVQSVTRGVPTDTSDEALLTCLELRGDKNSG